MEVAIVGPDGAEGRYQLPAILGRGSPAALRDAQASRKQFTLSALDGMLDAVKLEASGLNRERPPGPAC